MQLAMAVHVHHSPPHEPPAGAEHDGKRRHVPHQPGADQPALATQRLHLQSQDFQGRSTSTISGLSR